MSEELVTFERALTLGEADRDGAYTVQVGAEWSQGRAIYGGLVAALMSRALERKLPRDRGLRSALIDFIAPVAPGTAAIQATVLREGRALSHGEARIVQDGAVCAIFVGAYGQARSTSLTLDGAAPPPLDAPEKLSKLPYVEGVMPRFTQHFDYRVLGDVALFSGAKRANVGGYVRYPSAGPVDAAGVIGLLDAWPPAVLPLLSKYAPASTVTWMIDIAGELPEVGTRSDTFFRYEADGVTAAGGYASCEARLWAPDGRLVAASRQMIVEFS